MVMNGKSVVLRALCIYVIYELSVPTGLLKEKQISTLNNSGILRINNKYFNEMVTITTNITVRQLHMIACSQSTVHFKSHKYFIIKWSKYWYCFKQRG